MDPDTAARLIDRFAHAAARGRFDAAPPHQLLRAARSLADVTFHPVLGMDQRVANLVADAVDLLDDALRELAP